MKWKVVKPITREEYCDLFALGIPVARRIGNESDEEVSGFGPDIILDAFDQYEHVLLEGCDD